jgi:hypothetical protein
MAFATLGAHVRTLTHRRKKAKKDRAQKSISIVVPAEKNVVVNAQVIGVGGAGVDVMAVLQDRHHPIAGAVQVAAVVGAVSHKLHPNPSARPRDPDPDT